MAKLLKLNTTHKINPVTDLMALYLSFVEQGEENPIEALLNAQRAEMEEEGELVDDGKLA